MEAEGTEILFARLLESVAAGGTVAETLAAYKASNADLIEARDEALAQGIEREDVDPSWFQLT